MEPIVWLIIGLIIGAGAVFLTRFFNRHRVADTPGGKEAIEQTIVALRVDVEKLEQLVIDSQRDGASRFGEVAGQLKCIQQTSSDLHSALADTRARGQWGERMAEDILKLAGFEEGINYMKQQVSDTGSRPDYTFPLPGDRCLNMDVKFPLDNYMKYLHADAETDKGTFKAQFLADARRRIKEISSRDYINPSAKTLDYAIAFIPNEQVYGFLNENDRSLMDDALKAKVIPCSPSTLYAVLSVIRQGIKAFATEKAAGEMLSLFSTFARQWDAFVNSMDKLGHRLEDAQKEYQILVSTRRTQLERPLTKIQELQQKNTGDGSSENHTSEKGVER